MCGGQPAAVNELGVNGDDNELRTILRGYLIDEVGSAYGGTVDAHLVGSGIEQTGGIVQCADTSSYSKGNIYLFGYASDQVGEGTASLARGADVEVDEFVSSFASISAPEGYGIAYVAQAFKVDALDGASVLDIQAGYDTFG
jgi:hypothetical protein